MNPHGQNRYRRSPVNGRTTALDAEAAFRRAERVRGVRQRMSACVPSLTLLAGTRWVAAPAAVAETASVRCTGTKVIKYNPGVTFEERTLQINGQDNATSCVDVAGSELGLSFVAPFSGSSPPRAPRCSRAAPAPSRSSGTR